ncbi:hypothetical protein [Solibacillus merdavium]|uniref:Uncharacterized protein n=1 Tax=Solibacillus merdavium TaxID=2762218 RepID=A0ABR8XMG3_9BACL|nr:hypothetical protein [Solibacillus merdavium]MBD8033128.1 hypothetical protein [Solibacillus merdavium]
MAIILSINLIYAVLIWIFFNPKKSLVWLKRMKYKEAHQVIEGTIRYSKWVSLIGILMLTLIILVIFILTKVEIA